MTDPFDHEDWALIGDPDLVEDECEGPISVYVPSLVHLLHLLGGPDNVGRPGGDPDVGNPVIQAEIRADADGNRLILREAGKGGTDLEVHFFLPVRWATGEWQVGRVQCGRAGIAASRDLRRDVALFLDRDLGAAMAAGGYRLRATARGLMTT
jgi:hypothetical protein